MKILNLLIHIFFLFSLSLVVVACGKSPTEQVISDFDKLCKIYEDIAPKPISPAIKSMDLAERIQKELPEFYERDYQHITLIDREKTYRTIKEISERETKRKWDCEVMQKYYSGMFDHLSSDAN